MSDLSGSQTDYSTYDYGNPGTGNNFVSPSQVYEDTQVNPPNNNPGGLPASSVRADSGVTPGGGVRAASTAGATGTAGATAGTIPGISPDDLVLDPQTGELYGYKRTIEVDQATGKTVYGYQSYDLGNSTDSATLTAKTGIPWGALAIKIAQLKVQNSQTVQGGYGKLLGFDPTTGLFSYQKPDGTRATTANVADLAGVGIQPSEIRDSQAAAGQTTRTLTQMGQYTVAGMLPDGSLQVRDFNGTLSTVTAQQAAAGQIPGVSYADFQRAQSDYATNQRTITQAGQFTVTQAQFGPNGELQYNLKDYNGKITPYYGPQLEQMVAAGQVPGVTLSDLQQAQYHAQDMAWQLSPVGTSAQQSGYYFANGYGNAPTTAPGQQPPAPTPSVPNPAPPAQGGATPGATPTPTPTYASTPSTPGATPNPTPTPYSATSSTPGATPMTTQGGMVTQGGTMLTSDSEGGQQKTAGGASPSLMPALSSQQQASYNAYTSTPSTPGATSSGYASTPSTPGAPPVTHQQQQQNNQAYQQNLTQTTATNAGQSRNVSGLGFSGIQAPRLAGY